jgi:hypothetical protein
VLGVGWCPFHLPLCLLRIPLDQTPPMQSSHCLCDISESSPFAVYQQRRRSGYWIHRIQYMLPDNDIRKAEFDAAQPVRNQETGKVDYIVRVADHKTAEVAPGVITLEPHIHQLLCKYIIIRQHVLDSVNPVPRPASLLVNSKGGPFTSLP